MDSNSHPKSSDYELERVLVEAFVPTYSRFENVPVNSTYFLSVLYMQTSPNTTASSLACLPVA